MVSFTGNKEPTAVRGIGEIALRVNNLDVMQKFYEEILGLPLINRVADCAFVKIADGYGGHTQVLAYSTVPGPSAIVGRMRQLPPSTTSRSR